MIETDTLVIGAGPVGLFTVFELGLLEVGAHLIDALPRAGGQLVELYPDKPIYDIPGTPVCTARELIARLETQIAPFAPGLHLDEQVEAIERLPDDRFDVRGARGTRIVAGAIVVASGAGAFQPRRLKLDGLARFEGGALRYRPPAEGGARPEPTDRILVIGDEELAIETALRLARDTVAPGRVTLMHRRDDFRASAATIAALRRMRDDGRIDFIAAQPVGIVANGDRLQGLRVATAAGDEREVAVDRLLVLTGLSPKLGPIADWGLALERKQIVVDPASFATSVPGIFAVGDAVAYPAKKRLIVCGFHEATLAAFAVAERVHPGRPNPLEYTTTSPRLHRLLGVATP